MKSRSLRLPLAALFLATALAPGHPLLAHEGGGGESHQLLMVQPIAETGGRHVVMVTVSYAPGQVSQPHVHPGPVFAYVLEGSVVSQLEGQSAHLHQGPELV
ncbi:cupin domain-containing protein [Rhodanobacter ginsengisoli]|uniref:Cupin domain-containing protein n=1 Tax=Rhodanobacter ginsengisoli TaxID=418646 RepID=A0ABW0QLM6_9GAMM